MVSVKTPPKKGPTPSAITYDTLSTVIIIPRYFGATIEVPITNTSDSIPLPPSPEIILPAMSIFIEFDSADIKDPASNITMEYIRLDFNPIIAANRPQSNVAMALAREYPVISHPTLAKSLNRTPTVS